MSQANEQVATKSDVTSAVDGLEHRLTAKMYGMGTTLVLAMVALKYFG